MRTKKTKKVALAALSLFCGAALLGGLAAQNTMHASAEEAVLYERDFESLSANATADEIYGATYVAGANRSVVEAEKDYIEAIYTFFDTKGNGFALAVATAPLVHHEGTSSYLEAPLYTTA